MWSYSDLALETAFLARVNQAIERAGLWEEFATNWICLDCELMPWSLKALELLREQYAAVGAAGTPALQEVQRALAATAERGIDVAAHVPGRKSDCPPPPCAETALGPV